MNQEDAQRLFFNGAIYILHDPPTALEFGIDLFSWKTGEKFKGIKMIPPGIHLITFSSINAKTGEVGLKTSIFKKFKVKEVTVGAWDSQNEDIYPLIEKDPDQVERYQTDIRSLDPFLGAFPYDGSYRTWLGLTNHINDEVLERLNPKSGKILSVSSPESFSYIDKNVKNIDSLKQQESERENLSADNTVAYTPIDFKKIPKTNPSPQEITKFGMDKSLLLEKIKRSYSNEEGILGELQYAFVCFLVGQSFEGFEQWKQLIRLFTNCDEIILTEKKLFSDFLEVVYRQIAQIPDDLFVELESENNFLYENFKIFFRTFQELSMPEKDIVKIKSEELKTLFQQKYSWEFPTHIEFEIDLQDPDEDAPIVVEM